MTAQVQDRVAFDGVDHALVGIDGTGLFDHPDTGDEPTAWIARSFERDYARNLGR